MIFQCAYIIACFIYSDYFSSFVEISITMEYVVYAGIFLTWTLYLYTIHRVLHAVGNRYLQLAFLAHSDHHRYINTHEQTKWHWNNIFLYNDTWMSTLDLWITEVVPTILFAWITGQWWIAVFYYFWAAFVQETIEHNSTFDLYPFITSGKWHLVHHQDTGANFGLFSPLWDWTFGTFKHH